MQKQPKTKDKGLEIFKIQVDDSILPWVADGVPTMSSYVLICLPSWKQHILMMLFWTNLVGNISTKA